MNYSVKKHEVTLTEKEICLTLAIDTEVCAVIEYLKFSWTVCSCAAVRRRSWGCISRSSSTASAWHKKVPGHGNLFRSLLV